MYKNACEWFYKTKKWQETRKSYLSSKNYICERCGNIATLVHHRKYVTPKNMYDPDITLNWNNLEALCVDCHAQEHHGSSAVCKGLMFDSEGNLIKK